MRQFSWLLLFVPVLFVAWREGPAPTLTATLMAASTAALAESDGSATPPVVFVPIAPEATGIGYPPPVEVVADATTTSALPTVTPEPVFPAYTSPPLNRDEVGIQIYLHRQDVRELLRHFEALGVGWVKVQVSWKLREPRPEF